MHEPLDSQGKVYQKWDEIKKGRQNPSIGQVCIVF
jgi:hypothetical protein